MQTNVENGTEILHNVEHNLPSINQQMVNLDAEAVRNAMQNSHIMYQTARQTYTNFTSKNKIFFNVFVKFIVPSLNSFQIF